MKRNTFIRYYTTYLVVLLLTLTVSFAQPIADIQLNAEYIPGNFPTYSTTPVTGTGANGTFQIEITKVGANIPSGNFSIVVALASGVAYTDASFTVPAGFSFAKITASSLTFTQTASYDGSGFTTARTFSIPVQATAPIAAGTSSNWSVQIAREGVDYQDNMPGNNSVDGRVTVESSPLPVKLISFLASKENTAANLRWSTSEEFNSERFDVEHSLNGKNWNILGSVKAKGESRVTEKYVYIHEDPSNGENLYRLKMMDKDGSFAYSRIQSVTFENIQANSMVFPNPATDLLKLSVKDLAEVKTVKIFDLNGTPVYSVSGHALTKNIDIRKYPTGTYVVEIAGKNGQVKASKIVIIR